MRASEISHQALSSLNPFYVCQACGIIDRDSDRGLEGHACQTCGTSNDGALSYAPLHVAAVTDLMQHAFHSHPASVGIVDGGSLSTAIYFCTLGEISLTHLLKDLMIARRIDRDIRKRLLEDNLYAKQRTERLFPTLTGMKWKEAVKSCSDRDKVDYSEVVSLFLDVSRRRNAAVHTGHVWSVSRETAERCVDQHLLLLSLHVALHNAFVPDLLTANGIPYVGC